MLLGNGTLGEGNLFVKDSGYIQHLSMCTRMEREDGKSAGLMGFACAKEPVALLWYLSVPQCLLAQTSPPPRAGPRPPAGPVQILLQKALSRGETERWVLLAHGPRCSCLTGVEVLRRKGRPGAAAGHAGVCLQPDRPPADLPKAAPVETATLEISA
ncbi:hypothetical protein SKAU_G00048500 [Synaphobranchus kaupii]|uniref:Uncharacterized protein n=1 Tax=Synaphobranchus kaupii TaxID=118154 RepID=A0A9Q1G3W0_SYNKA|nr:hypothetical protein SKAU_G00048500 [Synaphobranchus kaupii]